MAHPGLCEAVAMWWQALGGALAGLVVLWVALLLVLWRVAPGADRSREVLRLLPDVLRLVSRLARDPTLARGVRVRLWLLLGYLALPFDLVPDFLPVIGYADDAVLVAWTLRSVAHRAGPDAVDRHWPSTPEGLRVVVRLAGLDRRPGKDAWVLDGIEDGDLAG